MAACISWQRRKQRKHVYRYLGESPEEASPNAHTASVQNVHKSNSTRTFELPPLEHEFFGPCGATISHITINAASAGAREDHVAPTPHCRLHVAPSKLNLSQNELHHCKSRIKLHTADATPAHNNNLTTMSTSTFAKYTVL
jgi:hypothetical protein